MSIEHYWYRYEVKEAGDQIRLASTRQMPWNRPWPLIDRALCDAGWHRSSIRACIMSVPHCLCHRCGRVC